MTQIAKTSAIRQKEAELKAVKKEHTKIAKQLQKVKQKLTDIQQALLDLQEPVARVKGLLVKMKDSVESLKKVLNDIHKNKKLPKQERKHAKAIYDDIISSSDFEQMMNDNSSEAQFEQGEDDEKARGSRFEQMFGQYRPPVPEVEQQQIRKVYLRLATKFHPDKTQNEAQAEQFHSLMLRINEAYAKNDLGTLLELETQYAALDFKLPVAEESAILGFLEREIDRLQAEILLLGEQVHRTKTELAALSNSEIGQLIIKNMKDAKSGEMSEALKWEAEIKERIANLEALVKGYTHLNETGEYSEEFILFMQSQGMLEEEEEDEEEEYQEALLSLQKTLNKLAKETARKSKKKGSK